SSEITRLNSQISFPQIEIQADQSLPVLISDAALNLHWSEYSETQPDTQPSGNHSNKIGVSDLTFRINDVNWQIPPWAIKIEQEGDQYSMQADAELLEVESIAELVQTVLGHNHTITSVLQNLNPKGVLRSPHIEIEVEEDNQMNYNALVTLDDIVLEPWRGGPGVEQLDGYLILEDSTCLLSINASPFGLYFPKLFDNKWSYQSAEGEIVWTIEEWGVSIRSGLLRLDGDHVNASGKIKIQIPYGKQEPELSLLVGVYKGTLDVRAEYLSNHPQVGSLMEWLNTNLISGSIDEGGILYQGSIQAGATPSSRNLQLVFDVIDLDMVYHPDWPELNGINGTIWVNDDELLIETTHAATDGVKLNNVSVRGQALDGTYALEIKGDVQDSGAKAVKFLQKTPIFNLSPDLLGQLEVSGELSARLDLTIPIEKNSVDVEYEVDLRTYQNDIRLPDYLVEFKQVEGGVLFSSKTGITSKQFTASFLGEPITGFIETIGKEGKPTLTSVQITGLVDLNSISHWYDLSQWPLLKGKTEFKAFLDLYYDRRSPPLLQVHSDLVGVISDYPAPLNKTAEQQRHFRFSMQLNEAPLHLDLVLDDDINFSLQITRDEPPRGSLMLGKGVANRLRFKPIELAGFSIDGNLQQLDLEPWVDWVMDTGLDVQQTGEAVPETISYGKDNFPVNRLNLEITDLNYGSLKLKSSQLSLDVDEQGIRLRHQTALFSGDSYWYFDSNRPLSINLLNLYINTEESTKNDQTTLKNVDPRALPSIDFYARKVFWNGSDTGRWKWVFRSDEGGAHLSQGSIKSADLQLDDAQVNWLVSDAGATTDVQLSGRVTDIAKVMKSWGMTPALSSESGAFNIKLESNTRPDQFLASEKNGEIHIEAKNGSFLSGEGGSALGFTNIFNFHGLMGRLSSSFA
ncbi:MAG: hypothetical protein KUG67_00885, partial [Proteobacteria bacterium]|nr:hypothetical protein [Pseudomonadota bacterium]